MVYTETHTQTHMHTRAQTQFPRARQDFNYTFDSGPALAIRDIVCLPIELTNVLNLDTYDNNNNY